MSVIDLNHYIISKMPITVTSDSGYALPVFISCIYCTNCTFCAYFTIASLKCLTCETDNRAQCYKTFLFIIDKFS